MIPQPFAPPPIPSAACRTAILKVCLADPNDLEADQIYHALALAELENLGPLIGMTTLFTTVVEQSGHAVTHELFRRWKALSLREEKRHAIVIHQLEELIQFAKKKHLMLRQLRGVRFAKHYYPSPASRHCHAIRMLLHTSERCKLFSNSLHELGWEKQLPKNPICKNIIRVTGPGKVEVALYDATHYRLPISTDEFDGWTTQNDLLDVLLGAMTEPQSHSDRWITDMVFLLRRTDVDSDKVANALIEMGIAGSAQRCLQRVLRLLPDKCHSYPKLMAIKRELHGQSDSWSSVQLRTKARLSEFSRTMHNSLKRKLRRVS